MTRLLTTCIALVSIAGAAHAGGFAYGQTVRVNGQQGQVISRGTNQTGHVVVETRNFAGRSTGATTLTRYDLAFRRQLDRPTPSFLVGPRNGHELQQLRSRGY